MPGVSPIRLPEDVGAVMKSMMARVEQLHREVMDQNSRMLKLIRATEFTCAGGELVKGGKLLKHLMTIPGVGELTAATWLAEVGDATRFRHPQEAAAFCGYDQH